VSVEIVVPVKQVPDLVEELEIAPDGKGLARDWLRYRVNEFDEQALEEALLLKEEHGGRVTVVAPDVGGVDETLYTCLAKGADRAVKVTGDFGGALSSHEAARILAQVIRGLGADLILTGVQAVDDLDGQLGPILASLLGLPQVGVVTGVALEDGRAVVRKEYAGGLMAELEVDLPAVLGIQASRQPPRYAPVSRVRQAMKAGGLEVVQAAPAGVRGPEVLRMFKPESGAHAEMLAGDAEEVADRIVAILAERGLLKG
jgi:electron transfer flavoprotein beta subunit